MTLLEYFNTPETVLPQELIYGHFRAADAPFVSHQRVVLKLATALEAHVSARDAGEVFVSPIDVVLDRDRALVLQPDLLVVSHDRMAMVHDRIYGAPDIVVEVLSPRPRIGKLDERIGWFAEYGVGEMWIYHQPDRRLDILRGKNGAVVSRSTFECGERIRSAVLPEFTRTMESILDAW